jgi:hypothetical protein
MIAACAQIAGLRMNSKEKERAEEKRKVRTTTKIRTTTKSRNHKDW